MSTDTPIAAASQKDAAVKIETTGWGLFFIWVGVCFLANASWAVFFVGTGALMLGLQAARHYLGLKLDRFGLVLGICFFVGGLILAVDVPLDKITLPDWVVPVVFVVAGAALLVSAWKRGPRH